MKISVKKMLEIFNDKTNCFCFAGIANNMTIAGMINKFESNKDKIKLIVEHSPQVSVDKIKSREIIMSNEKDIPLRNVIIEEENIEGYKILIIQSMNYFVYVYIIL